MEGYLSEGLMSANTELLLCRQIMGDLVPQAFGLWLSCLLSWTLSGGVFGLTDLTSSQHGGAMFLVH